MILDIKDFYRMFLTNSKYIKSVHKVDTSDAYVKLTPCDYFEQHYFGDRMSNQKYIKYFVSKDER